MTRRMRQLVLSAATAICVVLLGLFLLNLDLTRDEKRPDEVRELAQWIAERPADWIAAASLSDRSLDSTLANRRALWHEAHALAERLAPRRPNTAAGFVRAGLFHWYELAPPDRKAVLDVAAPLMTDPVVFEQLHRPMWQLTRDFGYLRRVAPPTVNVWLQLREIAVTNGRFADYRDLRESVRTLRMQSFLQKRDSLTAADMLNLLPSPLDAADEPLVRAILTELDQRAYDPYQAGGRIEELTEFAIAHKVQPLTALSPLVETQRIIRDDTRAHLARALGDAAAARRIELIGIVEKRSDTPGVWTGSCGQTEVCTSAFMVHEGPRTITMSVVQSDEVPPYVEIYVDDVLTAEGEVRDERTFAITSPGRHHTEVRLVNPRTRNGIQRRLRLS
jgi:hypothetical protein